MQLDEDTLTDLPTDTGCGCSTCDPTRPVSVCPACGLDLHDHCAAWCAWMAGELVERPASPADTR